MTQKLIESLLPKTACTLFVTVVDVECVVSFTQASDSEAFYRRMC